MSTLARRPDPAGPILLQAKAYDALVAEAEKYGGVAGREMFFNGGYTTPACIYGLAYTAGLLPTVIVRNDPSEPHTTTWDASGKSLLGFDAEASDKAMSHVLVASGQAFMCEFQSSTCSPS